MTSRRRVSTFSFSPNSENVHGGGGETECVLVNGKSALERKLELLEARFTMPLDQQQSHPQQSHQQLSQSQNHPHLSGSNNSSPDTLGEDSSPASVAQTVHMNNQNSTSQQSFGFDTPSLSYSNPSRQRPLTNNPSVLLTANKTPAADPLISSKGAWKDVAEAHMAKVAALQQQQQQQQQQQDHDQEDDEHTLVTSHVRPPVCVQESPPLMPPKAVSTSANNNPSNQVVLQHHPSDCNKNESMNNNNNNNNNKRKSGVPTKRNCPTVRDPVASATSTTTTAAAAARSDSEARKRMKLQFDSAAATKNATITNGTATRKKVSVDKSAIASGGSGTTNNNNNGNSRSNSPFRRLMNQSSNNSNSKTEASRDTTTVAASTKNKKMVSNNTKILDFFTATKKRTDRVQPAASPASETVANKTASLDDTGSSPTTRTTGNTDQNSAASRRLQSANASPRRIKKNDLAASSTAATTIEELQQKLIDLQRTCNDKDEQLKAVVNNRTILHSTLREAVRKRDSELDDLRQSAADREARTRRVLEDLVRTDAAQEARELRQRLAADGARLGRIVAAPSRGPPRLLLQRTVMESWEEGHAAKLLQQKRARLQAKCVVLEERRLAALEAEKYVMQQASFLLGKSESTKEDEKHDENDNDHNKKISNDNPPVVGGVEIRTLLDAREAVESVQYHLSRLRQQEKDVAVEEQTLHDEKGAHIRALKRVASEDASRFRSRPKLHDRYVLCSLLGKGGFSEVWRAYDLMDLREVAVKIHQLDSRWPESKKENYTKHVSREYEIHRNVRHPRIVSLYDVFEIDTDSFATVLEFCDGTDLDTLLKTKRSLPEHDARAILLQVLSGMRYLSQPSTDGRRAGIIHYDLKPGNILFDEHGDAKITDFGLSKIVDTPDSGDSLELTSQGAGTYWYLPPECFFTEDHVRISNKVDVWSIGVIFYQMLYGKRPFGDGLSQDKILADGTMLNAHEVKFPPDDRNNPITPGCKAFIRACLTYDQSFRPSIAKLCEHPYVLSKDNLNDTQQK